MYWLEKDLMMNVNPRVSIVVNNYNYAAFVGKAIESALNQDYVNKEILVVDDGSTDDSLQIISGFERYGVIVIKKENGGQASAINLGIEKASGHLIQILDADDILEPHCTSTLIRVWSDSVVSIQFPLRYCDKHGNEINIGEVMPTEITLKNQLKRQLIEGGYSFTPTSGNMYSRNALVDIMPIPEHEFKICADTYMQTALPFVGRVIVHPGPLGFYRIHDCNQYYAMSYTKNIRKLRQSIECDISRIALIKRLAIKYKKPVFPVIERSWLPDLAKQLVLKIYDPEDNLVKAESRGRLFLWAVLTSPIYLYRVGPWSAIKIISKMFVGAFLPKATAFKILFN